MRIYSFKMCFINEDQMTRVIKYFVFTFNLYLCLKSTILYIVSLVRKDENFHFVTFLTHSPSSVRRNIFNHVVKMCLEL